MEIEFGRREWYKKMNEALAREMEQLRKEAKQHIRYGVD